MLLRARGVRITVIALIKRGLSQHSFANCNYTLFSRLHVGPVVRIIIMLHERLYGLGCVQATQPHARTNRVCSSCLLRITGGIGSSRALRLALACCEQLATV